jgi:two-component system response regulator PilR (NtrC family)
VKLLRVLQERTVRAVGSETEIPIDVRLVAATNRPLEKEIAEGRFRSDLFYRLNVIRIHLPPLRERREDIPLLAEYFLDKHAAAQNKRLTFSATGLASLARRNFPGNVRELENMVERAVTLALGREIGMPDLPDEQPDESGAPTFGHLPDPVAGFDLDTYLGEIERRILLAALDKTGGVRNQAATLVGMTFRSLRYRLAKFGLGDEQADEQSDEQGDDDDDSGHT